MGTQSEQTLEIALFSDDSSVRETVKKALGSRIAPDLPPHTISEFATGPALRARVDGGKNFDLYILDGESVPEGGLGIAKQLKDEVLCRILQLKLFLSCSYFSSISDRKSVV